MIANTEVFERLRSDEVFTQGMLASDVRSLWRRLLRTETVQGLQRSLASDGDTIRDLCNHISALAEQSHNESYRHPEDIAICAGLILISQSPLSPARGLIAKLKRRTEPSLCWVRRMAEFCDENASENVLTGHSDWTSGLSVGAHALTLFSSAGVCAGYIVDPTNSAGPVWIDQDDSDHGGGSRYCDLTQAGGTYA